MATLATAAPSAQAVALAVELRSVTSRLKRKLREQAGTGDLSLSQINVLLKLEQEGPATASSLARHEAMKPQSMSAILAPLEAAGLLHGAPDPNDGRQTLVSLTKACLKLMREIRARREDWLTRTIDARLSAQEQTRLAAALVLLNRLVAD